MTNQMIPNNENDYGRYYTDPFRRAGRASPKCRPGCCTGIPPCMDPEGFMLDPDNHH